MEQSGMTIINTITTQSENDSEFTSAHKHASIRKCVEHALAEYFHNLDDQTTHDLYHLVLNEVEATLLEATLTYTLQNQSKASEMLGLNRGTLRKKLKAYGLL
tara:strand:- start:695 stop:1003 length:309 start_codon:yes stop_codon:yes gene_type:complete